MAGKGWDVDRYSARGWWGFAAVFAVVALIGVFALANGRAFNGVLLLIVFGILAGMSTVRASQARRSAGG